MFCLVREQPDHLIGLALAPDTLFQLPSLPVFLRYKIHKIMIDLETAVPQGGPGMPVLLLLHFLVHIRPHIDQDIGDEPSFMGDLYIIDTRIRIISQVGVLLPEQPWHAVKCSGAVRPALQRIHTGHDGMADMQRGIIII